MYIRSDLDRNTIHPRRLQLRLESDLGTDSGLDPDTDSGFVLETDFRVDWHFEPDRDSDRRSGSGKVDGRTVSVPVWPNLSTKYRDVIFDLIYKFKRFFLNDAPKKS